MLRIFIFKLVLVTIAILILTLEIYIGKKLAARLRTLRSFQILKRAYLVFILAGQSVMFVAIFYPGRGPETTLPHWFQPLYGSLMAINYAHAVWLVPFGLMALIMFLVKKTYAHKSSAQVNDEAITTENEEGITRWDFLNKSAALAGFAANFLPTATSVAAISGIFLGSKEIVTMPKEIHIRSLHDDLKGIKIVQLSDIHVGTLIGERYLGFTLDLIRNAKPDYIVVTGDIIDSNNVFLPVAGHYFRKLVELLPKHTKQTPCLLAVLGNHDLIDNGDEVAHELGKAGARFLRNKSLLAKRGNGVLQIAGLDYPKDMSSRFSVMQNYFAQTQKPLKQELPLVVLNHHPSDFEFLKTQQVDLVLSGHTHGGQINFSEDRDSPLNATTYIYKYYIDHYSEAGSQLYVNRGLGHWFPLRIHCPPEITVLTLV